MERINYLEVETSKGIKTISVFHGDIIKMHETVDILFVSIFHGGLSPIPDTLLGSLSQSGIDIVKLYKKMAFNFRKGLNTWVSTPLSGYPFKRILFVEMRTLRGDIKPGEEMEEIFENLFLSLMILEKKGVPVSKVAMPLLGTGNQNLKQEKIIPLLLSLTQRFLDEIDSLQNIYIIEKNSQKALSLSEEFNKSLGRADLRLNSVSIKKNVRKSIISKISIIRNNNFPDNNIFDELINIMLDNESRSYQIGILGRRTLEFILGDLISEAGIPIFQKIVTLKERGIAEWIISYMHLLRVFGNESAHQQPEKLRIPSLPAESDLQMNLLALDQILEFWIKNREKFKTNLVFKMGEKTKTGMKI